MAIFRVPGEFDTIEAALGSRLVQRGDTILVKEGAYNKIVIVPYTKMGIHIVTDRGRPSDGPEDRPVADEAADAPIPAGGGPFAAGPVPAEEPGENPPPEEAEREDSAPAAVAGEEPSPPAGADGSPVEPAEDSAAAPRIAAAGGRAAPSVRTGTSTIRMRKGAVSPYWLVIRRRTVQRQ